MQMASMFLSELHRVGGLQHRICEGRRRGPDGLQVCAVLCRGVAEATDQQGHRDGEKRLVDEGRRESLDGGPAAETVDQVDRRRPTGEAPAKLGADDGWVEQVCHGSSSWPL